MSGTFFNFKKARHNCNRLPPARLYSPAISFPYNGLPHPTSIMSDGAQSLGLCAAAPILSDVSVSYRILSDSLVSENFPVDPYISVWFLVDTALSIATEERQKWRRAC
jgi:hypothetical protein